MSTKKKWRLKTDSLYKMIVWFKDGNIRTMYSMDWKHAYSPKKDPAIGLARLHTLIKRYGTLANRAEIYSIITKKRIASFVEGKQNY